jgi:rhizosphere induced protein
MANYTVHFVNNSSIIGSFCVFQQVPEMSYANVFALAWFSKFANPGTRVSFSWSLDYCFFWDDTGELVPGITFDDSEILAAGLTENNSVTLTKSDGGYQFIDQKTAGNAGSLTILTDTTIPANQASVGIGMSGAGTFAIQAEPNINYTFTPHPAYWVAFGNFAEGEVLDTTNLANTAQVIFPANIYAMNVTLNPDSTWTITQTAD